MRNYAVKLGPTYLMYGRHYTNNPEHPEIIRCTLEDALIIASAPEEIVIHPSADANQIMLQGTAPDGQKNEATYKHRQFIHDWAYERPGTIIRVVGENGFYTNDGFSPLPVEWTEPPRGWAAFELKGLYTSEHGALYKTQDSVTERKGIKAVNKQGEERSYAFNADRFRVAKEWLASTALKRSYMNKKVALSTFKEKYRRHNPALKFWTKEMKVSKWDDFILQLLAEDVISEDQANTWKNPFGGVDNE